MLFCLQRQGARVYEIKTDSVLYRPLKRAKKVLQNLEFKDMSQIRCQFDAVKQRRLDQFVQMPVSTSCETVYRVGTVTESDLMKMQPQGPKREVLYEHEEFEWKDLTETEAEEAVM